MSVLWWSKRLLFFRGFIKLLNIVYFSFYFVLFRCSNPLYLFVLGRTKWTFMYRVLGSSKGFKFSYRRICKSIFTVVHRRGCDHVVSSTPKSFLPNPSFLSSVFFPGPVRRDVTSWDSHRWWWTVRTLLVVLVFSRPTVLVWGLLPPSTQVHLHSPCVPVLRIRRPFGRLFGSTIWTGPQVVFRPCRRYYKEVRNPDLVTFIRLQYRSPLMPVFTCGTRRDMEVSRCQRLDVPHRCSYPTGYGEPGWGSSCTPFS